jgi:ubiquinone/menaquinone biosynthesis C-methylase UbiE
MAEKGWESQEFADTWKKKAAERRTLMHAQTEAMFDAAGVRPGSRVLELGTGTGDTALLAGERVGAQGSVLATDFSPSMVQAAKDVVREAAAANVTVRQMDGSAVDVEPGTFDAVIARQVLMFLDRTRAFAGILRALKGGGRLGAVVWGPVNQNPFHGLAIAAGRKRGGWNPDDPPQVVRAFAINEEGAWTKWLAQAGFVDVTEKAVRGERRFASADAAFEAMRESPIHADPIERLGEREKEEAWVELQRVCEEYGGVFPTLHLVLSARKAE